MRTKRFYSTPALIRMFKSQILSYIEGATPAIYHASPSTLDLLDSVFHNFLLDMNLSIEQALVDYDLAPLGMRRDIAMLGLLWKVSRKLAPGPIQSLFSLHGNTLLHYGFNINTELHDYQISDPVEVGHPTIIRRSIFGLVRIWNLLPRAMVRAPSVKAFQRLLQNQAKVAAEHCSLNWDLMYHAN